MFKRIRKKKEKPSLEVRAIQIFFSSFLFFLIILLIVSNIRIHQRRLYLKDQIDEKKVEVERLMVNLEKLEEADSVEEDFIVEKIAREQLLLKKEGEEVVFISFPEEINYEKKEDVLKNKSVWWNPLTWSLD